MTMRADTIYALSSGHGRAGVAVIRISGPGAFPAVDAFCDTLPAPRRAALRLLRDPADGSPVDQALVLLFPGPRSFTGEDCAELQVHGSIAVQRKLLTLLGRMPGLRAAESGEFSKRAYFNGKLSLLDVEALGDLLAAETELQRRLALDGASAFSRRAAGWREQLIDLRARVEAEIDFSDEGDVTANLDSDTERESRSLIAAMRHALSGFAISERVRSGFRIAILGPPNAGKSTLLNSLAERDIAITAPSPGTTRDVLEADFELDGLPLRILDTAGLREETQDQIEAEGMRRASLAAQSADLVLWLSPADQPVEAPDSRFISVTTKADLLPEVASQAGDCAGHLLISARSGLGLPALIALIRSTALGSVDDLGLAGYVASERQKSLVEQAILCLEEMVMADDVALRAESLRAASVLLERLIGRIDHEAVFDAIFSRFCIGK